jgi:DNA repair exonuclease SbcCD ATPase subunit
VLIKNIAVTDFRNIEETSAELEPLTIIRGHNHQGKSSIAQAIQIALTARAEGTDGQGRGANDKIRAGAKKATIAMELRGKNGIMPFAVSYGPNKTGRQITTNNPAQFIGWLEGNSERLACVLDTDYFVRQKAEDQKAILASLVLPTTFEFPQDKRELAEKWLLTEQARAACDWSANPVNIIDTLYASAFEQRKTAKASLAAIHIPELPNKPMFSSQEVNEKLAGLRTKIAALAKKPSGTVELGRLQEQLRNTEAGITEIENDIEDLRTSLNDAESNVLAPVALKAQEKLAAHRVEYRNLEDQVQELARQVEEQRNVEEIYRELLAEKRCPTCHQPISEDFIKARIDDAKKLAATAGEGQREAMRQQKAMGNIADAEELIEAHKRAIEQKANFQRELAEAVSNKTVAGEKVRELRKQIAAIGNVPETPHPTAELDALHDEMSKLERLLAEAIGYETAVKQAQQLGARKQAESAKVAALETLVAYFGKDGVKATLIQENIDQFTASVNSVLRVWGYSAVLSIEPYSFDVTNGNGKALPLKELSGSEKLMFGVALQTAIAHHSKINMVLVDKADTFLGPERNRLFGCLDKLIKDGILEQAIVLVSDEKTEAPQKPGVVFFAAQDGKLVKL